MLFFSKALLAFAVFTSASPASFPSLDERDTTLSEGTGSINGFYYSFWTDKSSGTCSMTSGSGGQYNLKWDNIGNVVAGKGWKTGSDRQITYTGTFNNSGNTYLAVYGWTRFPLVEYYIVESYGEYNPGIGGQKRGSVTTDDGTYDIYTSQRTNAPSIQGTASYPQFWSIRTEKRVGGKVSTSAHFEAWKKYGLKLGTFDYQIVATEGYKSSGESSIDVWL
ncbi:C2H2 finger domain transcription factor [Venturia nashicola]|nr:C2H2 finger domain transcription factor [Venturia nashicola]